MLYFGTTPETVSKHPLGRPFFVIYSPNATHRQSVWRLIRFVPALHKNPLNPSANLTRMYEQISTRPLSDSEVEEAMAYLEAQGAAFGRLHP